MRFVSIAFSFLLAFMPSLVIAQNQAYNGQTANEIFLPQLLHDNSNASIFYDALVATGLKDTLNQYWDSNYPTIDYERSIQAIRDHYAGVHRIETIYESFYLAMPDKREFKYTIFVVSDSDLVNNGIHNLDELRQFARSVYPEGASLPDKDRASSLNRLLSYHILPFWLPYDQINVSQPQIVRNRKYLDELDIEDFYETLLPHSVMRISTPYNENGIPLGVFINRKGTIKTRLEAEGIEISKDCNSCINGGYYYISSLLLYDSFTRNNTLNTRMRIMASTLSPDFINSGARGRLRGDPANNGDEYLNRLAYSFKPEFCKNINWIEDQTHLYVKSRDVAYGIYYGDEVLIQGSFDIAFRLPSVPSDGLYEIRIPNVALISSLWQNGGTTLFYLQKEGGDLIPLRTPVNLNISLKDSLIGAVSDGDEKYYGLSDSQKEAAINADDLLLHKKGYLKSPDSYGPYSSASMREDPNIYRLIISELYMEADKYYYLRLRQVSNEDALFPLNYIELVPYSVYSGENGPEDKH